MCGGKAKGPVVATYNAGEYVPVRFEGSARHGGVHHHFVHDAYLIHAFLGCLPVLLVL